MTDTCTDRGGPRSLELSALSVYIWMRSGLASLGRGSLWGKSLRLQPSGRRRLWLIVLHTFSAFVVVLCLWEGLAVPIGLRYSRVLDVSMVL